VPPERPTPTSAVPDSEALRQSALRASWRRDRQVGRRRRWTRWLVWALCRYGLPLLLATAAAIAVVFALSHILEP